MKANIGNIDRALRLLVGLLLIAYAVPVGFSNTGWNWVGWIGVIPVLTAVLGFCPLYRMLGLTTCPVRR